MSRTGIWNLEYRGPSDLCVIVCIQERKQLCHSFMTIFNKASSHFAKMTLTDKEIVLVKGSLELLHTAFEELRTVEGEINVIALEDMKDEA